MLAFGALASVLGALAIEATGHSVQAFDRRLIAWAARLGAYVLLYLCWFALSARPLLSAASMAATLGVMRMISESKRRLVGEPFVFSDFALLKYVVRNPGLYFPGIHRGAAIGIVPLCVSVGLWIRAEPVAPGEPAAAGILLTVAWFAMVSPTRKLVGMLASRLAPRPDLTRDEASYGIFLTLLLYVVRWRDARTMPTPVLRALVPRERAPPLDAVVVIQMGSFLDAAGLPGGETGAVSARVPAVYAVRWRDARLAPTSGLGTLAPREPAPPLDAVVVIQMESFLDPAVLPGGETGAGLARIRARSLLQGALRVPTHGAYTMRSEFAVLSGVDEDQLAFEAFDPYLTAAERSFDTLAHALKARGYETVFVHPYRPSFFGRDRVMPALGFDRLVMERDFADAERVGPYVSDEAVAARVMSEVNRAEGPIFVYAATMENHGPWMPDRLPGMESPLDQYRHHLANADRLLAVLLDELFSGGRRVLLCVFGDHPPILGALGPPSRAPTTTYAVVDGRVRQDGAQCDLSAAELGRVLRLLSEL